MKLQNIDTEVETCLIRKFNDKVLILIFLNPWKFLMVLYYI